MSALVKNSAIAFAVSLIFAAMPASAIILMESAPINSTAAANRMPSLLVSPLPATESTYLMARARSWGHSRHARGGRDLVMAPAVLGQLTATSERQANLRTHLARAQAYRLGYFDKR